MSEIRDEINKITKQLEQSRLKVGGTLQRFSPRPYPQTIAETVPGDEKIPVAPGGLLVAGGSPVFVYIRDHLLTNPRFIDEPRKLRRIHFTFCNIVFDMQNEGTYESRYHVTNRTDDHYPIDVQVHGEVFVNLFPCGYCLRRLNYKGYRSMNSEGRQALMEDFNAREAMIILNERLDDFRLMAKKLKSEYQASGYAPNHERMSRHYRSSQNFICEVCGVDLHKYPYLTDLHHIDRNKRNNNPDNWLCLCKLCHGETHSHYKINRQDERRIRESRKRQNVR